MDEVLTTGQPRKNIDGSINVITTLPDWFRVIKYRKGESDFFRILISDENGIVPFNIAPDHEFDKFLDAFHNLMILLWNNYVLSEQFPEVKIHVHF